MPGPSAPARPMINDSAVSPDSGNRTARVLRWPPMARARQVARGTALAAVIALAATFVSRLYGGPQLLYALFFGISFHYLSAEPATRPGIDFCARGLLRLGVGLLGARITVEQIVHLGWETAATVVAGVVTTMAVGLAVGRWLGLSRPQRVLSGGAVAICGASAALAISAVLPREKDSDRFTAVVVVAVTVLSTVAMVLYPLLCRALHIPAPLAGLFLGGSIHDVAQVVGAGYTLDVATGDTATIVKLFRVSLLTVVVVVVSLAFREARGRIESASRSGGRPAGLVPWFLWMFIALVLLNSLGVFSAAQQAALGDVSRGCLVVAIAALGIKTSFADLARTGWRPMLLILAETVWIAAVVLGLVMLRA